MESARQSRRARALFWFVALSVGVALLAFLGPASPQLVGLGLAGLATWAVVELVGMGEADRRARLGLALLMLLNLGFWLAFGRVGQALLALVGERGALLGLSPGSLALLLAAAIVALAPIWWGLWAVLRRRELEPSPAAKFSLAFVILALGCFCLGMGIEWSRGLGPVGAGVIGLGVLGLAAAASCLGPAGLEAVAELEQPNDGRAWLALWLLGYVLASASTSRSGLGPAGPFEACVFVGYASVLAGVGTAFAWRPLAALRARQLGERPADGRVGQPGPSLALLARSRTAVLALGTGSLIACTDDVRADEAGSTTDPGDSETSTTSTTDTGSDDEQETTGETGGECGDGVVDPGEACDDGNLDEGDGCTASCEIGPCGFEWIRSEPAVVSDGVVGIELEASSMVILSQAQAPAPWTSSLSRASRADGALVSSTELALEPSTQFSTSFTLADQGDVFVAGTDEANPEAGLLVQRLTPEGALVWQQQRPGEDYAPAIRLSPAGELLIITTVEAAAMDTDAKLVALDPADGTELWAETYGGQTAANGYSLDRGRNLAVDEQGRVFVGVTEYVDWDTSAAVLVAYPPGGGAPLWIRDLVNSPGDRAELWDLALDPTGTILATAIDWDQYFEAWAISVEPEAGMVQWVFDYDDLPIERIWTAPIGIAGDGERVIVGGYWSYLDEQLGNQQVVQAYALGLALDGSVACIGTYDEYDPQQLDDLQSWVGLDVASDGVGEFYMAGYVISYFDESIPGELLVAKIR
jgi:cysteine-rich repeat protein